MGVLLVVGGIAVATDADRFGAILGFLALLWSLFGLLPLAAQAMDDPANEGERRTFGSGLTAALAAIFIIPSLAAAIIFLTQIRSGLSAYDECIDDPDTTFSQCQELEE